MSFSKCNQPHDSYTPVGRHQKLKYCIFKLLLVVVLVLTGNISHFRSLPKQPIADEQDVTSHVFRDPIGQFILN